MTLLKNLDTFMNLMGSNNSRRMFFDDWPINVIHGNEEYNYQGLMDIYENEDEFVVKVTLPGVQCEYVNVVIEKNRLIIKANPQNDTELKSRDYLLSEIIRGYFNRIIIMPSGLNVHKTNVYFIQGILNIIIPKLEDMKSKGLEITVKNS